MRSKLFNVAGPCNSQDHYMVSATKRLGTEVRTLIDNKQYFVIHAARQSGKTTLLKDLTRSINSEGKYHALYCSLERLQGINDVKEGIPAIVSIIKASLTNFSLPSANSFGKNLDLNDFANVLNYAITAYCKKLKKPFVLFFDEADCLSNGTLISFLRQLRDGYVNRPDVPFIHSLALVGMRNIRDYKAHIRPDSATLGSASPFNIVTKALTLRNFTKEEVSELYSQHTATTKQRFEQDAVDYVYEQTQGQPWLVNAIARECVEETAKNDYSITITKEMAHNAIQDLILRRDTHFDSLMERLKEERVKRVIEPMLIGGDIVNKLDDDYKYTRDLGLIRDDRGCTEPANPIYAEVIARTLNYDTQVSIGERSPDKKMMRYEKNGKVDLKFLLKDFQDFWRENGEIWENRYYYKEAAPQLIMQAFLQRVINGGGQIIREIGSGRGRVDICVVYKEKKYPIELKIRYGTKTLSEGLEQTAKYMDKFNAKEGALFIFDRRKNIAGRQKYFLRTQKVKNKNIIVVGG